MARGHYRTVLNTGKVAPCPKKFLPDRLRNDKAKEKGVRLVCAPKVLPVFKGKPVLGRGFGPGLGERAGRGVRPFPRGERRAFAAELAAELATKTAAK